ncbi:MAG TPA: hypothetical protein PLJ23_03075 [Gemmatimonadales bacterium]|nr:hypothetical protein [Gemmatimonadales bacterium]
MSGQPAWAAVISYGYVAVEVAAALFILARWRSLAPPSRLVGYWLLVAASFALIEQVARIVFRNSQYVAQLWYPLSGALALTAVLAAGARRGTVQVVVACYLIVQVVLFFTVEVYGEYAKATGLVHGVALVIAGGWMVLRRALYGRALMTDDRHFMQGMAFLMIGAPSALLAVAVRHFGTFDIDQARVLYAAKNLLATVAVGFLAYSIASRRERLAETA